jgi:hypothetical protein
MPMLQTFVHLHQCNNLIQSYQEGIIIDMIGFKLGLNFSINRKTLFKGISYKNEWLLMLFDLWNKKFRLITTARENCRSSSFQKSSGKSTGRNT